MSVTTRADDPCARECRTDATRRNRLLGARTAEITQRTRDSQNTRQDHSTTQITQSVALQNISLLRVWSKWRSSTLPRPPARIEDLCQIRRRSPRRGQIGRASCRGRGEIEGG